jgi:hypothetical protein
VFCTAGSHLPVTYLALGEIEGVLLSLVMEKVVQKKITSFFKPKRSSLMQHC